MVTTPYRANNGAHVSGVEMNGSEGSNPVLAGGASLEAHSTQVLHANK